MSNLLLRGFRETGVVFDRVLTFARPNAAVGLSARWSAKHPEAPRTVMWLEAGNTGQFWVVSEADAQRLEACGHIRFSERMDASLQ